MSKMPAKMPSGKIMKWKDIEYPSVYANLLGFGLSPFDIAIVFGEIGDSTETQITGIPRVKVLLSPEQAANLVKIITVGLNAYVEGNGGLRSGGAVDVEELRVQVVSLKAQ